jgi:hypothetical protein
MVPPGCRTNFLTNVGQLSRRREWVQQLFLASAGIKEIEQEGAEDAEENNLEH